MNIPCRVLFALLLVAQPAHARYFYTDHIPHIEHDSAGTRGSYQLHTYTSSYTRTAHEAFTASHGTKVGPLSALYFGKDEFRMSHMFENCLMPLDTQHYNPYVRVLKFRPRVRYTETGTTLGFKAITTLFNERVRTGVRVEMPFKHREVERQDSGSRDTAPTQDLVNEQSVRVDVSDLDSDDFRIDRTSAYRLDYLEALGKDIDHNSTVSYTEAGSVEIFDRPMYESGGVLRGAFITIPESSVPRGQKVFSSDLTTGKTVLPATLTDLSEDHTYYVDEDTNYSGTSDSATKTVAQRIADQDTKAQIWYVSTFDDTTSLDMNDGAKSIQTGMADTVRNFNANHFEWFHDRGVQLESAQQTGIGDTTLEFFTSVDLHDHVALDVSIGATLPTASGTTAPANPYHIHLGRRNHVMAFVGSSVDVELSKRIRTVVSTQARSAIDYTENRCAMPTGAQVKNLGAISPAHVSWHELSGRAELFIMHPAAQDIEFNLGYNFYYKTNDHINFIDSKIESWLGKKYSTTTRDFTVANTFTPDKNVSALNSEVIAHTVQASLLYRISDWMQLTVGGSYVVAGKNCPQTVEAHAGCVIVF